MRRLMAVLLSVGFFFASALLNAETIRKMENIPGKKTATQNAARVTRMTAAGVVKDISGTSVTIERKVKDQVEAMEFALEKPLETIKADDKVRVTYVTKEGRHIAIKVTKDISPAMQRKVQKPEGKAMPGGRLPTGR